MASRGVEKILPFQVSERNPCSLTVTFSKISLNCFLLCLLFTTVSVYLLKVSQSSKRGALDGMSFTGRNVTTGISIGVSWPWFEQLHVRFSEDNYNKYFLCQISIFCVRQGLTLIPDDCFWKHRGRVIIYGLCQVMTSQWNDNLGEIILTHNWHDLKEED